MCKSSSPPVPNSTSTAFQSATSPSATAAPYYTNYLAQAAGLAQTPFNPATLGTAAPMDAYQLTAGPAMFNSALAIPAEASGFANYGYGLAGEVPGMVDPAMASAMSDANSVFNLAMGAQGQAQPVINLGMGMQSATQPIISLGMGTQQRVQPIINAGMTA